MRGPSDLNINVNPCSKDEWSALKRVLQNVHHVLAAMANGEGTLLRFRLTGNLAPGGKAAANITRFNGDTGFEIQRSGVVYDEQELWHGKTGDYGWCTARDHSEDNYSVVLVPATLGLAITTGDIGGDYTADSSVISSLFSQYGAELPPLGVWVLFGTLTATLTYHGTSRITINGTPLTIAVHDFLLSSGERLAAGEKVVVAWDLIAKQYQVITRAVGSTDTTLISILLQELGGIYFPPGGIWLLTGTLSATLSYQGSATMAVTGSAQTLTVYDALLRSGQSIVSTTSVTVGWNVVHHRYEVLAASCV